METNKKNSFFEKKRKKKKRKIKKIKKSAFQWIDGNNFKKGIIYKNKIDFTVRMDLSKYYYKQTCPHCCSAQSVSILYNYIYRYDNSKRIVLDRDFLRVYPEWLESISNGNIIGLERLSVFVDRVFDTESSVIMNPSLEKFVSDIMSGYVIIYYGASSKYDVKGHYSPILNYNKMRVKIGLPKYKYNNKMSWVSLNSIMPRLKGYIYVDKFF